VPKVLNARNVGTTLENSVYVGRPSKFGNPFEIGKDGNRKQVIAKFVGWLSKNPELIEQAKRELAGKNLICWCAPKECHADILLRIANAEND
jgi:hypothetical protein